MPKFHGRRQPYTGLGIRRVPCARCGQPSVFQWSVCANGNRHMGFCEDCDVAMNAMVLAFVGFKNAKELLEWYIKEQGYDGYYPAFSIQVPGIDPDRDGAVNDRGPDQNRDQSSVGPTE